MSQLKSEKIRIGNRLKTTIYSESHGISDTCTFFEIDNLDSKVLQQAENNYEKAFITIRDYLRAQKDIQHNFTSEVVILTLTQNIIDSLNQANLIRKEEK